MLQEGTRGNRNFIHALCICWWQIRMAGKLVPGGHPRCASGTDGPSPRLQRSNRATSYLGGWWETHILALGSEMSVIYRSKWKLKLWPRILLSGALLPMPWQQEPRVTQDRLKVKCSWDSHLIKESAIFKEWAECCQWLHRILPGMIFNLYTYDLWTCNNYQITYQPPLLETNDQADGLHIGFVISLVEKNKGCDKNAALAADPPFVPSNCWWIRGIACLSNPHWNSQALGLSGGGKTKSCNSQRQSTVSLGCKHHLLPENSHSESCAARPPIFLQSFCGNPFLRPCFGQRPVAYTLSVQMSRYIWALNSWVHQPKQPKRRPRSMHSWNRSEFQLTIRK